MHIRPTDYLTQSEAELILRDIKKFFGNRLSNKEVHPHLYRWEPRVYGCLYAYRSMEVGLKEKNG